MGAAVVFLSPFGDGSGPVNVWPARLSCAHGQSRLDRFRGDVDFPGLFWCRSTLAWRTGWHLPMQEKRDFCACLGRGSCNFSFRMRKNGSKSMLTNSSRERLDACLLHLLEGVMHRAYGKKKRELFRRLPARVVEIGPGTGANLRYYPPGASVIAVEPNRAMHPHLLAHAAQKGIDVEIKPIRGEQLDLPTNSVDAVVGTFVLCTVDNPLEVLSNVHRILRPLGCYVFLEHVAAPDGSCLHHLQDLLNSPWKRIFQGCNLNRDTAALLRKAGFSSLQMDCFRLQPALVPIAPHIFGLAIK